MTQEQLADVARVHRTYVGKVERGEKEISLAMAMRLANAAGAPLWRIVKALEEQQSASVGARGSRNG